MPNIKKRISETQFSVEHFVPVTSQSHFSDALTSRPSWKLLRQGGSSCTRQSQWTLGIFQPYCPINKYELFQLLLIMPKKTYVSIICQPNSVVHDYLPATLISVVRNKHFSCLTPDVGLHCKTGLPWVSLRFILSLINFVKIVTPISKPFQVYLEAKAFDLSWKFCSVMYSKKKKRSCFWRGVLFPFRILTCVLPPTFQNLLICSFI